MPSKKRHPDQVALIQDLPAHSGRANAVVRRQRLELEERAQRIERDPIHVYVQTDDELENAALAASLSGEIVIDCETRTTRWQTGAIVSFQIYAPSSKRAYFVPIRLAHANRNFTESQVAAVFRVPLHDATLPKIGHELKYDLQFIYKHLGIDVVNYHYDTLTASRILNENEPHDLEELCVRYCRCKRWKITHGGLPFELWPVPVAVEYGCLDVVNNYKLWKYQLRHLKKEQFVKLRKLCYDMEFPNVRLATKMERRGVGFDSEYFAGEVVPVVRKNIEITRQRIFELAGFEFDLNQDKPHALAAVLYDQLKLPRLKENHVDGYTMLQLKQQGFEIAEAVIDNRKWTQIDKMFVRQLPKYVINGRIYATANTTGTETGRWTMNHPNLQQIPKKIGPLIRRAFIPSPGFVFVTFDYDQGELRMLAHGPGMPSGDEVMIEAFKSGMDFHAAVLCIVFNVDPSYYEAHRDEPELTEKRTLTKNINFGTTYGMSEYTLAIRINKSKQEAKQFQTQWFNRFPGARRYVNLTPRFAYEHGYVETIMGRKRRLLPGIRSSDQKIARAADREAVNAPIQGSVADLIKMTMNRHDEMISQLQWPYHALLNEHDEILYEVPQDWLESHGQSRYDLKDVMENIYPNLRCPMKVSMETLTRWGDKTVLDYDEAKDEYDYAIRSDYAKTF
jgi:DNA polymerase-1